jgi:hypothetical protein
MSAEWLGFAGRGGNCATREASEAGSGGGSLWSPAAFPPAHLMAMSPFEVTVVACELSAPPGVLS